MDSVTAISTTHNRLSENSLRKLTTSNGFTRHWRIVLQSSLKAQCRRRARNFPQKRVESGSARFRIVSYKRSWREFFQRFEGSTKREKGASRSLWKLPQPWKSAKVRLRRLLLDDFHRCLEKPAHKSLRLFHSYHRPDGDQLNDNFEIHCHLNLSHLWGAVQCDVAMKLLLFQMIIGSS